MRAFGIVLALVLAGAAVLGVGAKRLDEIAAGRPDLAVRAGNETYFIPSQFVRSDGWRTNLLRAGGCWDARDAAVFVGLAPVAGCDGIHRVRLALPVALFGQDVAAAFHSAYLAADFWPIYLPPAEEMSELGDAWHGRGVWAGRQAALRDDWKLWRIETAASPWVYLLSDEPRAGDATELARLYAGRCYRPERIGDAGMTCEFVLHVGTSAVFDFSLGADEVMSFVALREALTARAGEWRSPQSVPVSGSFGPSA